MKKYIYTFIIGLLIGAFSVLYLVYDIWLPGYKQHMCADVQNELNALSARYNEIRKLSIDYSTLRKLQKETFVKFITTINPRVYNHLAETIADTALHLRRPKLVLAVAAAESHFNPLAVSRSGARGLTQIRYQAWHKFLNKQGLRIKSPRELHDPRVNLAAADIILDHLIHKYGLQGALRRYHSGKYYRNKYAFRYYKNVMYYLGLLSIMEEKHFMPLAKQIRQHKDA